MYIGCSLLGFSVKEVQHFTLGRLMKLYEFYKKNYDFQLSRVKYSEMELVAAHKGEWF